MKENESKMNGKNEAEEEEDDDDKIKRSEEKLEIFTIDNGNYYIRFAKLGVVEPYFSSSSLILSTSLAQNENNIFLNLSSSHPLEAH